MGNVRPVLELYVIAEQNYDALGNLRTKNIGNKKQSNGAYYSSRQPLDTFRYDYNVRGWQLGMNRDMAKGKSSPSLFGYDIGYDNAQIQATGESSIGTYATPAYNGNIGGITWKSVGDGEIRKYDYQYDAANRLVWADFKQRTGGTNWSNAVVNFSVKMGDGVTPSNAYDENGNIRRMNQWGLTLTGSKQIDSLSYNYYGNNLKSVTESATIGSTNHQLGDFTDGNRTGDDYGYDRNGNAVSDKNKMILGPVGMGNDPNGGGIRYNHLNLPRQVIFYTDATGATVKGTIDYLYTAEGAKQEKKVTENNVTITHGGSSYSTNIITYTRYINGLVLEAKSYSNATLNTSLGYNNRLQFGGQPEGRVRAVYGPANDSVFNRFEYDYMVKDHLGNVRMVLTEEYKQDEYPAATMETAQAATEDKFYANLSETRWDRPSGYTDTYTSPNDKVAKVRGDGNKIGPAILLKVMAGDKFNIKASAWWSGSSAGVNTSPLSSIVSALIGSAPGMSGGKLNVGDLTSTLLDPQVTAFLATQPGVTGKPKAYLNWVLFDEQFKFVGSSSSAEPVEESGVVKQFNKTNLPVDKNGYLYIYVSNETNVDVFFDNLQVTHVRGSLLEESHYYPFG